MPDPIVSARPAFSSMTSHRASTWGHDGPKASKWITQVDRGLARSKTHVEAFAAGGGFSGLRHFLYRSDNWKITCSMTQ